MTADRAVVSLHHWQEFAQLGDVLAQCLADLGGMAAFVRPGQTVVIKPNITANAPSSSGGTTYRELVEAIIRQVQTCQAGRIVVAEGTGAFGSTHASAFPTGGWREMAARLGIELYNLDAGPHQVVTLEARRYPNPLPIAELVLEADVFISVPCLKTHLTADYTVALKNSFALITQQMRSQVHGKYMIEQALVDINRSRKPDLTVVDGWDGAEGIAGGTDFQRPAGARLMLVGADPVAVDVVSRALMAFGARTRYLNWAIADGVGVGDLEHIELRGETMAACCHPFMSPTKEMCQILPDLTVHDQGACSGCRVAALSAMQRFRYQKLLKPVDLALGGEGEVSPTKGVTLVIGNCAAKYAPLGHCIGGCPASQEEIIRALEEQGCVCRQCRDLAGPLLEGQPEEFLAHLRVAASGRELHSGKDVRRGEWHLELLVGDCMRRYAFVVRERAAQFGLDAEKDVVWLRGCPADAAAVSAALAQLRERLAQVVSS
jgi:uncharacterized protein (DUF362 family)